MSQHRFQVHSVPDGRIFTVMAGWDRPLGYLFLVITDDTHPGSPRGPHVVFSNLDLPQGPGMTTAQIGATLQLGGIAIPAGLLEALEADRQANRGNAETQYPVQTLPWGVEVGQLRRATRLGIAS